MEQAIINVEGTSTIETAAAAKKLIETFGSQNIRALSVKRVDENSNEVVVELDFVPGLAPHLHGFALQVNGLTAGYDGTGPSNLYEVLQAAGVDERLLTREDITQKLLRTVRLNNWPPCIICRGSVRNHLPRLRLLNGRPFQLRSSGRVGHWRNCLRWCWLLLRSNCRANRCLLRRAVCLRLRWLVGLRNGSPI